MQRVCENMSSAVKRGAKSREITRAEMYVSGPRVKGDK